MRWTDLFKLLWTHWKVKMNKYDKELEAAESAARSAESAARSAGSAESAEIEWQINKVLERL